MPDVGSLNYTVGPLIALTALGVLVLILRWAWAGPRRRAHPLSRSSEGGYGLLRPVLEVATVAEAHAVRAVLSDAGIRSTVSPLPGGRVQVMVFAADVERASLTVGPR